MLVSQKNGATILEIVVVVSILSLLMSLVAVGVNAARESSRKVTCGNHLRQMGIALHNFESRTRKLPNLRGRPIQFENGSLVRIVSIHFDLLGDLELSTFQDKKLPNLLASGIFDMYGQPRVTSHPLVSIPVPVFQCPSDSFQGIGTSYRFCTGPDAHSAFKRDIGEGAKGPFGSMEKNGFDRCRRGLSNTIFASERNRSSNSTHAPKSAAWLAFMGPPFPIPTQQFIDVANQSQIYPPTSFFKYNGHYWIQSGYDCTLFNSVFAPNSKFFSLFAGNLDPDSGNGAIMTATSNHHGGVQSLYGDGSVDFVSEQIDLQTWRALATCE